MVLVRNISVQTTAALQFVDITEEVERAVEASGVEEGVVMLRSRHTTAALTCTEGDPSIHEDCLELLREQLPVSRDYRHSQEGAENAVAHLAEMMIFGESTWAPIRGGKLDLGTWQRLFLVELFEPRMRTVDVAILGD
ncbi:MAG: YjbQ family protein [Chloroflexi bacterium]|nr:YjbQ family protein [Chloroflexota bacterium]